MRFEFDGSYEEFRQIVNPALQAVAPVSVPLPVSVPVPSSQNSGLGLLGKNLWFQSLPPTSQEGLDRAEVIFGEAVRAWLVGFGDPEAKQPDRVTIMQELGAGSNVVPILRLAEREGCLQNLVLQVWPRHASSSAAWSEDELEQIEQVAATMAQICHAGFPDLGDVFSISPSWRSRWTTNAR